MKIVITEEVWNRVAFSRKMYCSCGSHSYSIRHQVEPKVINDWWIQCNECEKEGPHSPLKQIAIARWKQL